MKFAFAISSLKIKLTLVILGLLIALATLIYTQNIVDQLQKREKEIVQLFASGLEFAANPNTNDSDLSFIFNNIINRIDFPLILTDRNDNLVSTEIGFGFKNIKIDTTLNKSKIKIFLQQKIKDLANSHPPILVKTNDGIVLQKIYYGDSDIINKLKFYPYLQIIFAFIFLLIAYLSFSYIKRSEQSNIWVGMSKETAHQLGTPISSLMGWNEILKMNYKNPDKVLDTAQEIENDLSRLNKITRRFSKIGSKPELIDNSPYEVIEKVINYFQRRLPQLGKNVSLNLSGNKNLRTRMNAELFEWVIENLIKNSLDAIENKVGFVKFSVAQNKKSIEIEITDNGKGIESGRKKDVFRPGFSTKKRGWGLGLSLSKRIIEDYHKGKIFVKSSAINEGTTFKIILPA